MGTHDDIRRGGSPLSTEDLAGPGAAGEPDPGPPAYPGEATGESLSGGSAAGRGEEDDGLSAGRGDEEPMDRDEPMDRQEEVSPEGTSGAAAGAGADGGGTAAGGDGQPLLDTGDAERFRTAWAEIQGRFVDDPREAVTSADTLVAEVMQSLAGTFASHKQELEGQWQRGDDVATEDLRQALQHYRSFFNRLLNA
ncbi:hypothetical protein WDV06_35400 [Streptomyces racemochromogenes]|uniref:Uncharacterized protein n=1 Tax=Streptomyces racemochromogenes TaxID=67353 RepID=A0ABW7PPI6_9ACTN